jgi:hypothetical protein
VMCRPVRAEGSEAKKRAGRRVLLRAARCRPPWAGREVDAAGGSTARRGPGPGLGRVPGLG